MEVIEEVVRWIFVALFGLVIGSFLGAVAYRVPRGESLIRPPSTCPRCGVRLRVGDLVPIFSFVANRGACRFCTLRISWRYPLTELATAGLFAVAYARADDWATFAAGAIFLSTLIAMFLIDLEHMLLPNKLNAVGLALGLGFSALGWTDQSAWESLQGAAVGYGVIFVIAFASRGGMGMGDAKFLAVIGSFLGPIGVWCTLIGASLAGTAVGVLLIALGRHKRREPMPFGPHLAASAAVVWIFMQNRGLKSLVVSILAG